MRGANLVKGLARHPLHLPLTDATIGVYTAPTVVAFLSAVGISERNTATASWLALVLGLIVAGPTALTELIDWLGLKWDVAGHRPAERRTRRATRAGPEGCA